MKVLRQIQNLKTNDKVSFNLPETARVFIFKEKTDVHPELGLVNVKLTCGSNTHNLVLNNNDMLYVELWDQNLNNIEHRNSHRYEKANKSMES